MHGDVHVWIQNLFRALFKYKSSNWKKDFFSFLLMFLRFFPQTLSLLHDSEDENLGLFVKSESERGWDSGLQSGRYCASEESREAFGDVNMLDGLAHIECTMWCEVVGFWFSMTVETLDLQSLLENIKRKYSKFRDGARESTAEGVDDGVVLSVTSEPSSLCPVIERKLNGHWRH